MLLAISKNLETQSSRRTAAESAEKNLGFGGKVVAVIFSCGAARIGAVSFCGTVSWAHHHAYGGCGGRLVPHPRASPLARGAGESPRPGPPGFPPAPSPSKQSRVALPGRRRQARD